MKKFLFFASALAGLFLAASCQQESLEPVGGNTVTYTVQVPDALATKALGDDVTNVNVVHYEVYRTAVAETVEFTTADNLLYHKTAKMSNGTATINLELINDQNYTVLFWAQVQADMTALENEAYVVSDLTNVTIKSALNSNQEAYAAFAGVDFIEAGDPLAGRNVTLVRSISQLNIATTPGSLTAFDDDITLNGSSVTVAGLSNTFDVAKQEPSAAMATTYTYSKQAVPTQTLSVNGENYAYVAMNYVGFAAGIGSNVTVSYVINTSEGDIDNTIENVPVKPNFRTNIVGNLITSTSDYTVDLDAKWAGVAKEYEIWDGETLMVPATNDAGEYIVSQPSEWAYLANLQNPATKAAPVPVVINLTSNLDFGGNELTGLVAARSNSLTVNGNGYTIMNAKVVSGTNDNGTATSALFVSLPNSILNVENLDIKNVNVVTNEDPGNGYAGVLVGYAEGTVNIESVNIYASTAHSTQSIGGAFGFIPANGDVTVKDCTIDGLKLTNADVKDESGAMGGFVGRVAGKLTAENVKVSNSTIEAYVGTDQYQKRSISKFIGNFVNGAVINVTGAVLDNVTLVAKNELAETQSCLYTEYLGGWRDENNKNEGSVSINGVEITKGQTNEDITVDTPAELAAAISNADDGAVIPVSGEIATTELKAGDGKSITIVGMTDDAAIDVKANTNYTNTSGNITFQNLTIKLNSNPAAHYNVGFHNNGGEHVYDNCKFEGCITAWGDCIYNNCEFVNNTKGKYAAWVYAGTVVYNKCTFSGNDRAAKVFNENPNSGLNVTYNNCTFKSSTPNKTAVEVAVENNSNKATFVAINNARVENMGTAKHYAIGESVCNLESYGKDGAGNDKYGLGIVTLDGKGYSVAHTAAQLQALAWAVKEEMGVTTVEVADGTYSDDITLTVPAAGKTAAGNLVFKAAEGASPVIAGTVTLGYRNQGVGAAMWNCAITFDGITFDHANAATHSLDVQDVKSLTLKNCKIIGDGEFGLTSARGNGTGKSSIVGCTFENAAMQLFGNFATDLVIDGCTFNESRINVQAGNGVTVQNCNFTNTLTNANVGDSFYLIRSNSTPITVKKCNINIDSELTNVAANEINWAILHNRGNKTWEVENVSITMSEAALDQTELFVTKCTLKDGTPSGGTINTTNLTVNGNVQ